MCDGTQTNASRWCPRAYYLNAGAVQLCLGIDLRLDAGGREVRPDAVGVALFGNLAINEWRYSLLAKVLPRGHVELAGATGEHQDQGHRNSGFGGGDGDDEDHQHLSVPRAGQPQAAVI